MDILWEGAGCGKLLFFSLKDGFSMKITPEVGGKDESTSPALSLLPMEISGQHDVAVCQTILGDDFWVIHSNQSG